MTYDLPSFTIISTFYYQIHIFNTENSQNGVGKLGLKACTHELEIFNL